MKTFFIFKAWGWRTLGWVAWRERRQGLPLGIKYWPTTFKLVILGINPGAGQALSCK